MKKERLFLDIHAIQVLPPSNVNRDDTGSPKTALYGGVTRARVSSQSWKRAMRQYFNDFGGFDVGVRTKDPGHYVAGLIREKDPDISEKEALSKAVSTLKIAMSKKKAGDGKVDEEGKVGALFFIGRKQAEALADAAIRGETDWQTLKTILNSGPALDIALFGRMLADNPSLNEDASSQVAHAISTHEVQTEYDYFTASDDLQPLDNAGAAMLDTIEFNSSTLYRYANVAVHEFFRQMGEDQQVTINALKLYVKAFSNSMPTGKSNTFANQTVPQALLVFLRDDRPVSFVQAFENPVRAKKGGYTSESIQRLFGEENKVEKFVRKPVGFWYVLTDQDSADFSGTKENSLDTLLDSMGMQLQQLL